VLKRASYFIYYRVLAALATFDIPLDSGDFCVMSRRVVLTLNALPERNRFVRGLRSWIGFTQTGLEYERHARAAGEPKYTFAKLTNLALDGIFNFSYKPLRVITLTGIAVGMFAMFAGLWFLIQYVGNITIAGYNPRQGRGWTSLILAILFLSATQLFGLGVLGEYLGRLFEETKNRPMFIVETALNIDVTPAMAGDSMADVSSPDKRSV
jgi:dolichol-phosphate mannosyltransferase